ncbi:MAG: hypothetical protein GY933_17105 [Hyphomicrobiales bacterium]|nr:hypothetical protein [Hyphomicrobiales bacterium]
MIVLFSADCIAQGLNPRKAEINAFVHADANGDGVLTKPEFVVFVKEMAKTGQSTARTIRFFRAYNYALSVADKDKDGIVTPKEMRSADNSHRAGQ